MLKHRILLADDHRIFLAGLQKLLSSDFDVVGTVEDGRALLAAATKLAPDMIVLDVSMPLLNGIEAARQLAKIVPQTKVAFSASMRTALCGSSHTGRRSGLRTKARRAGSVVGRNARGTESEEAIAR
jgi:CheY-like chemotaxis protein